MFTNSFSDGAVLSSKELLMGLCSMVIFLALHGLLWEFLGKTFSRVAPKQTISVWPVKNFADVISAKTKSKLLYKPQERHIHFTTQEVFSENLTLSWLNIFLFVMNRGKKRRIWFKQWKNMCLTNVRNHCSSVTSTEYHGCRKEYLEHSEWSSEACRILCSKGRETNLRE